MHRVYRHVIITAEHMGLFLIRQVTLSMASGYSLPAGNKKIDAG
jgi:hypothetical protein